MFRELKRTFKSYQTIYFLVQQDLKIAHRDKVLGNIWVLLDPLLMMVVLFMVFRHIRHAGPIFVLYLLSGLLAWDVFQKVMRGATLSIRARKQLIHRLPALIW